MRVFLDTNVLASAFATRGLCADLLRLIIVEHQLISCELVLHELRSVLRNKFGLPADDISEIEQFLRSYHVEADPEHLPKLKLRDRNDLTIVGAALNAGVEVLITGDHEILSLATSLGELKILSPRAFWDLQISRKRK